MQSKLTQQQISHAIAFHGHECLGLWIGLRAAELCLEQLGHNDHEPLTVVTETDMCGVDAIQVLTGCTFGKGNLIHRDYGKNAFSFYRQRDGKGLRAVLRPQATGAAGEQMRMLTQKIVAGQATDAEKQQAAELKEKTKAHLLNLSIAELFEVTAASHPPRAAKILDSLICAACGESTMESRARLFSGGVYCIPCFKKVDQKL